MPAASPRDNGKIASDMPDQPKPSIRETLLALVHDMEAKRQGGNLQQSTLLNTAAERLVPHYGDRDFEQAILTQWQELFRTGLLAWGHDLNNPNPPFFHLTARGARALANATRDPSNPTGYLRHLEARVQPITAVTRSYVVEALECYAAGFFKASAVMIGAAAENVILELRHAVVARLQHDGDKVRDELQSWKVSKVTTELGKFFAARLDSKTDVALRDRFDMYWSDFAGQIRSVRNDAGHPVSVDPVTPDTVHASLLIFPELASLAEALYQWTIDGAKDSTPI